MDTPTPAPSPAPESTLVETIHFIKKPGIGDLVKVHYKRQSAFGLVCGFFTRTHRQPYTKQVVVIDCLELKRIHDLEFSPFKCDYLLEPDRIKFTS